MCGGGGGGGAKNRFVCQHKYVYVHNVDFLLWRAIALQAFVRSLQKSCFLCEGFGESFLEACLYPYIIEDRTSL